MVRPFLGKFTRVDHHLVATEEVFERRHLTGRIAEAAWRVLVGTRLASAMEGRERVGTARGLAVFASDNISSSAYATEEIMRVLVLAGAGVLTLTMPITLAIVVVLGVVVVSYRQTVAAYPTGGGSYIVASSNLGRLPGLTAGAALLIDYVLTVAVSVAAGVAALTSIFPVLYPERVVIAVAFVLVLGLGNLRGLRESATIFSAPLYIYLAAIFGLLGYGLLRYATGGLPPYVAPPEWASAEQTTSLGLLLVLRAFASGSVALTGVEAVSNGVPAFAPPESKRAQHVLVLMGCFFGSIFLGMSFLAARIGILPDPSEQQTVVSQLAGVVVGAGSPYHYLVQLSTALLLVLAANTAFADFPRLSSILARDGYWPHQFGYRGDRLAFSTGIIALTALAGGLLILFSASVTSLIPLYTVGVFMAFTLSQAGMVRHWWYLRREDRAWRRHALVNALGGIATGTVAVVVGVAKFAIGAWVVFLLIPSLMAVMIAISRHYRGVTKAMALRRPPPLASSPSLPPRVIVPVGRLDRAAYRALRFARTLGSDVQAVHVSDDREEAEAMRARWQEWQTGIELTIVESPYRALLPPLLAYIDAVREAEPDAPLVVVLGEVAPPHFWQNFLHNQVALRLKVHLFSRPNTIVVDVPTHLEDGVEEEEALT